MAIKLQKGQTIELDKNQFDLSSVTIGLGWDIRQAPAAGGFLGAVFGSSQPEYDLDAVAFLLDANGKVANLGNNLVGSDVIFYNNLRHPSGNIWLTGDNRTGAGDGDDEQIIVKLNAMSPAYERILFLVTIYQGRQNNQHFGMVDNAFIRAVDARGVEIARFDLSHDAAYQNKCAVTFAEAYRMNGAWKFRAIGDPHETDAFVDILRSYTR
jgi:stress response protein SCP2